MGAVLQYLKEKKAHAVVVVPKPAKVVIPQVRRGDNTSTMDL